MTPPPPLLTKFFSCLSVHLNSFVPKYYNSLLNLILPRVHLNILLNILIMDLYRNLGLLLYLEALSTEYSFDQEGFDFRILRYFIS